MPDGEIKIKIDGLDDAKKRIEQLDQRLSDPTPAMDDIGNMLVTSILRNFEVGGRPPWPDLKPSTWARKTTDVAMDTPMKRRLKRSEPFCWLCRRSM